MILCRPWALGPGRWCGGAVVRCFSLAEGVLFFPVGGWSEVEVLSKEAGEVVAIFEADGGGDVFDAAVGGEQGVGGGFHAYLLNVDGWGGADLGVEPADKCALGEADVFGEGGI